jgi:hypothetical protein
VLGLTLYSREELLGLARQSRFGWDSIVEPIALQNLPIFLHILLPKEAAPTPAGTEGPNER